MQRAGKRERIVNDLFGGIVACLVAGVLRGHGGLLDPDGVAADEDSG